jgi:hypothetical protein
MHPGDTDPFLVGVLRHLWNVNQLPNGSKEEHVCELCGPNPPPFVEIEVPPHGSPGVERFTSAKGEFFVEDGPTRHVLPNLVLHYVLAHRYKLPEVVEAALLKSAPFTREDWEEFTRFRIAQAEARARTELEVARQKGLRAGLQSGLAEGLVKGELLGKKEALLRLLARAGLALTSVERARVEACTDEATLDRWLDKVVRAKTAAAVLSSR